MLLTLRLYYLIITSLTLLSCTVGPDFQAPEPPNTNSYAAQPIPPQTVETRGQEGKTQRFFTTQSISQQWWNLFQCNSLNELIDRGLKNNLDLQAAQASLRHAQENLTSETGKFFPSIDGQMSGAREKISEAGFGLSGPSPTFNLYNVGVNVSYAPDIFGALRRQVESLEAQVDYQRFELEATYLTLTTNIVTAAIREASLRAQIDITKELIAIYEKQFDIRKSELPIGSTSQNEILTQSALLAQTKATLPPLEVSLQQTRHALAILIGELPSEAKLPTFNINDIQLPTDIPITIPSTLVQSRPDIKAAEALLNQANAQIGVAKANMFPLLMLTGTLGGTSNFAHKVFAGSSNVWSIGSNLLQPIFRGGAMIAKENAAIATYEQTFAQYRQTVLKSFQQVADTLTALVEDAKTYKALSESESSLFNSWKLSQKQYRIGAISLFTLLNTERQYLQSKLTRIQAEATRYANTAALFQALGGDCFSHRLASLQHIKPNNHQIGPSKESEPS